MRAAHLGTCRLCLSRNVVLRESHVIPRWAYRRLLQNGGLVQVIGRDAVPTHEQLTEHLLCHDCEQLCGRTERKVSELTAKRYARLGRMLGPTIAASADFDVRQVPEHIAECLARFAAIMVWRASVSTVATQCHLGAKYEEQFRTYILQPATPFPASSSCFVLVHDGNLSNNAASSPVTNRSGDCHFHRFPLCGLEFLVFVGGLLPGNVERLHILRSNNIALAAPGQLDAWLTIPLMRATPRGRLARPKKASTHSTV